MSRWTNAIFNLLLTSVANPCAAEFLPLTPGNSWTYREAATGQSFTVSVAGDRYLIGRNVYYAIRGYGEGTYAGYPAPGSGQLLVRTDEAGNLVYWDGERKMDMLLTSFEQVSGSWWMAPYRHCTEEGRTMAGRGSHADQR